MESRASIDLIKIIINNNKIIIIKSVRALFQKHQSALSHSGLNIMLYIHQNFPAVVVMSIINNCSQASEIEFKMDAYHTLIL